MAGYKSARCKRQSYSGVSIQIVVSETLTLLFCLHSCGNDMSYSHQARVNITTFSGSAFQGREERNKGRNYKT